MLKKTKQLNLHFLRRINKFIYLLACPNIKGFGRMKNIFHFSSKGYVLFCLQQSF